VTSTSSNPGHGETRVTGQNRSFPVGPTVSLISGGDQPAAVFSLTLSACRRPSGMGGSSQLPEVGGGAKQNQATTPPGLVQTEWQGRPAGPRTGQGWACSIR